MKLPVDRELVGIYATTLRSFLNNNFVWNYTSLYDNTWYTLSLSEMSLIHA